MSERSDRMANNRFGGKIRNRNEVEMGLKGEITCYSVDVTEKNNTLFELWRESCSNHKKS